MTPSASSADSELVDDLVAANRILAGQGVLDGFGHVSARHDKDPGRYLLARSMAPALVTAVDIMEFDLDSNAVDARGRTAYLERFIHGEIYKAQPEVQAIVHSHSPAVIPFGVVGVALRPIFHLGGFLGVGVPVFEIRDAGGPATDMLIGNPTLGAALAKTIGSAPVALMRGHGNVVVGRSIKEAVSAPSTPRSTPGSQARRCGWGKGRSCSSTTKKPKRQPKPTARRLAAPGSCGKPRRSQSEAERRRFGRSALDGQRNSDLS